MKTSGRLATLFGAAAILAAQPALAHLKLTGSTPAADSAVASPAMITLRFSERVVQRFSSATVTMASMPGMTGHKPTLVAGLAPAFGADGKTLTLRLARRLTAGGYRVAWKAVAADTHRIEGTFAFTVR